MGEPLVTAAVFITAKKGKQLLPGEDGEENEYEPATGGFGGGICNSGGTIKIKNTIVVNYQVALKGEGPDCFGTFNSMGHHLVENTLNCTIIGQLTGNITGVDPRLAVLGDNSGPGFTHALLINSPAVDAGTCAGISIDQRGFSRPVDMPGITNVNYGTYIGVYELSSRFIEFQRRGVGNLVLEFPQY
jgi:hypothetical protein